MTSVLAQQLRKVSLAIGKAPGARADRASLLYSASEAADTDTQTIFTNAIFGLEDLVKVDIRFLAYRASLFANSTLSLNRSSLTADELGSVNKSITSFLRLLGPHFLHAGCFKTLEYLLRKYQIHIHNAQEVLAIFLPFHETNQYVRLVQAMQLDNTLFIFLKPMQTSGAALPRSSLVERCKTDKGLLQLICDKGREAGNAAHPDRFLVTLYAVLVCELLAASKKVDEDVVRLLLPFLLHGVGKSGSEGKVTADFRYATHMILMQLSSVASLAPDFLEVLMQQVLKYIEEEGERQAIVVVCHLLNTQPQIQALPKSAGKVLVKLPGVVNILTALQAKQANVNQMLQYFTAFLCGHISRDSNLHLLQQLVDEVELGGASKLIAGAILKAAAASDPLPHKIELQKMLRTLDLKQPEHVDAAINEALKAADSCAGEAEKAEIAAFVTNALKQSGRSLLEGEQTTVAHAIDAPTPQLRIQAIKQLEILVESESELPFIREAILRRFSDEDPAVLDAALSSPAIRVLPPSELVSGVSQLLKKARVALTSEGALDKSGRKILREAVKKALRALAAFSGEERRAEVIAEALNFVLGPAATLRISKAAISVVSMIHPFTGFAAALEDEDEEGEEKRQGNLAEHCEAAVKGFAAALEKADAAFVTQIAKLADLSGKHFLFLALNVACSQGCRPAVESALQIAEAGWSDLDSRAERMSKAALEEWFDEEGCPTVSYFEEQAVDESADRVSAFLQRCLLKALQGSVEIDIQRAHQLFDALSACKTPKTFRPHLKALTSKLGDEAPNFLSEIFGLPSDKADAEKQVKSLLLLGVALEEASEADLSVLIPRLFAALTHPAEPVRSAAIRALDAFPKGLHDKSLPAKQLAALIKELQEASKDIKSSEEELPLVVQRLVRTAQTGSSKPTTRRKSSGTAKNPLSNFLLEALPRQEGLAGINAARVLLRCMQAFEPAPLLETACILLNNVFASSAQLEEQAQDFVEEVWSLFTPEAAESGAIKGIASDVLAQAIAQQDSAKPKLPANLRIAAAKTVTSQLFENLDEETQQRFAAVLMISAAHDVSNEVRKAAQKALEGLKVQAGHFLPSLFSEGGAPKQSSQRITRSKKPVFKNSGFSQKDMLIAVLELLQWKSDIQTSEALLKPLSECLTFLMSQAKAAGNGVSETQEDVKMDEEDDDDSADDAQNPVIDWVSNADYLIQLTLNALSAQITANPNTLRIEDIDLQAIVECLTARTEFATRDAAIHLLAKLTSLKPQETLNISLQVITAIGASALLNSGKRAQQTAAAAFGAICPAWVASGREPADLADAALESMTNLLPHRALPVLAAMVSALPQKDLLPNLLLAILQKAAKLAIQKLPEGSTKGPEAPGLQSEEALLELASLLSHQVSPEEQLKAFSKLLEASMELSDGHPDNPLVVLATGLVASEVKQTGRLLAEGAQPDLEAIVRNSLLQLQVLGAAQNPKRTRTAILGVTNLLKALEFAMSPALYLKTLLSLLDTSDSAIQRRALRLFENALPRALAPADLQAAIGFSQKIAGLVKDSNDNAMRQAALVAFSALAAKAGQEHSKDIVAALPDIIILVADSAWIVRSSALAAITAAVMASGAAALPVLPRLVSAVLSAADAATEALAVAPMTHADSADGMEVDGEDNAQTRSGERQQLEAQAAIAAVKALSEKLGQFLSPYLPAVLTLLLRHGLLEASSAVSSLALEARASLTRTVSARLLLPALISHLEVALTEGEAAILELLIMAAATVDFLKPAEAAAQADLLWAFILRVLDLRGERPSSVPAFWRAEESAVQLLVKLTLKLSETQFKPRFLHLLDWAAAMPSIGERRPERQISLFKVATALANELRGVFVPYFRHLLPLAVDHLGGSRSRGTSKSHKKRKSLPSSQASEDEMILRFQVIRALHSCFLYDRQGFLSEEIFQQLLPPIVAQLGSELPSTVSSQEVHGAAAIVQRPSAELMELGLDAFGEAVIEAIVQMAVTANKDFLWKPLHHQVLMASRSENKKERYRSLEAASRLVEKLGEEYVILLPEAMPFLAELLEDPEIVVQNRTRKLLKQLEEMSGESLEQYLKA